MLARKLGPPLLRALYVCIGARLSCRAGGGLLLLLLPCVLLPTAVPVVFMFLIFCTYYVIDIAFNLIEGKPLLMFDNLGSLGLNYILVSIFTIINLTKNIKLLK